MPDWVAIAGISGTAFVAITSQAVNALMKRGDRKHESQLDFEKRVWEAKSAALVEIVTKCQRLKDAADVDPPGGPSPSDTRRDGRRRVQVLMEFGAIGRDLYGGAGASLLAYADQSVTKPVAALSKLLSHEHTKVISQAGYLEYLQEELESMIDSGGGSAKRFDELQEEIDDAEVRIGSESTLNVDEVEKLCSEILGAARRNLRGE
ncbi:hypothetical protein [Mycolicibacterium aichiense]|uniref:Uncharacterized protein n=1 Tax=Mycolicibacterium aichiense TaxID=1799 RepID=A0AAD1MBN7_9MYCO|nr:hypothetical protein [Mycolicibacterium aichiense]MCV7019696.1 hypothetical protein [Mycolicibacterium aichiense]BBX06931.1 hypothetical protein MAIC_17340 [Mycolicibacterium aichiense]